MRIISKFKDYYDSAQGLGLDTSIVFRRLEEEILCGEDYSDQRPVPNHLQFLFNSPLTLNSQQFSDFSVSYAKVMVFFCGKVYRGIQVILTRKDSIGITFDVCRTFYTFGAFVHFLAVNKIPLPSFTRRTFWNKNDEVDQEALRRYVNEFLTWKDSSSAIEELVKARTVCLYAKGQHGDYRMGRERKVVNTAKLSDVDFFRVIPPTLAFQEIEMYLSGVLGDLEREVINISDKDRIHQHGFDDKSFRKAPTKRKVKT